ncbi:MAG: M3 family oligoendopeptidase [Treponema sp.]|jgi:pepF/M3 family oligoendopeptidase|nr:M3 family oligoendopeptidase [Treponema sp.]
MRNEIPRWNLDRIYRSFDSPSYKNDKENLKKHIETLLNLLEKSSEEGTKIENIEETLAVWEDAGDTAENLRAYAEAVYTADTADTRALMEINALETTALPLGKARVLLYNKLKAMGDLTALFVSPFLKERQFFIKEAIEKARYQMTPELEDLANDLARSGASAWERLHESVSSAASGVLDGENKTVTELRALAMSPYRNVRKKAFLTEIAAWKNVEDPLAAALNGVKGFAITLDRRRGWISALQKSAFQSRLSERTLSSLISALESALPMFRRYLKTKAHLLNVQKCAFFDLFAPVGLPTEASVGSGRIWTFDEASTFVVQQFMNFDENMGKFAQKAVDDGWIDAEMRKNKVGGAYCANFPLAGVSRVLCNFDGTFDSVNTIAHELGHAWHHEIIKDLPRAHRLYPMTLAETASVFAETIVFEGAFAQAETADERLFLLEGTIKDYCQIVVDILSRFYFEKELFERREKSEIPASELCKMMLDAQKRTYGDALDPQFLHPYMWAAKSHYYSADLGFYNYPYAFGQLFSLCLFASAKTAGFSEKYRELLRLTGCASVEECMSIDAAKSVDFTFDEDFQYFFQKGLTIIGKRIEEMENAVAAKDAKNLS